MTTNRDRILSAIRNSSQPLDDDQLSRRSGVAPRQTVNMICRQLAIEGTLRRAEGPDGKIVNELLSEPSVIPPDKAMRIPAPLAGTSDDTVETGHGLPGASHEQRMAETVMLRILSESLGVELRPRKLHHPSGARVEVDGADQQLTALVECWAHQGPAKVAQKNKLVTDAVKLHWVAQSLSPAPERLILCVSDPAAIKHLQGSSWHGAAIAYLGVSLEVVQLPQDVVVGIVAAQKRQYR